MNAASTTPAAVAPLDLEPHGILLDSYDELRRIVRYRALVRYLVKASLGSDTAHTLLGYVWWVVDPMLYMAVYYVLVHVVLRRGAPNYPLFVFVGVLTWRYFTAAVTTATSGTHSKLNLMKQAPFPRTVVPLSAVLAQTFRLIAAIPVLMIFAAAMGFFPDVHLPLFFLVLAVELILAVGLSFITAALNIFVRDTLKSLGHVFRIGLYLSPVLYSPSTLPPSVQRIYGLNPFATILPAYRNIIIYHRAPDYQALGLVFLFALGLLAAGFMFYVRLEPQFTKAT